MARYLYAASPADYVVDANTGLPIPGAVVTVWSARSGGSQITDLQDLSGTAVSSVTANAQGFYAFYCPDSYTENVWLSTGTGDRLVCRTVESPALVSQVVGKAGGTMTGPLVLSADPTLEMHAATKQYVDEHSAGSVTISGGTLTGNLVLSSGADLFIGGTGEPRGQFRQQTGYPVVIQPSDNSGNLLGSKEFLYSVADGRWQFECGLRVDGAVSVGGALAMGSNKITGMVSGTASGDAVNKGQLDAVSTVANDALPKSGGTMTGAIAMGSSKVTGLADGTASGDAVNKGQLDTKVDTTGDTMTGDLTLNVSAGSNGWVNLHLDGVLRWRVGLADASGIGADFMVQRFNSSGVYIDSVFYVDAADGKANFPNGIKVPISGGIEYVF